VSVRADTWTADEEATRRRFGVRSHNHSFIGSLLLLLILVGGLLNGFGPINYNWIALGLPVWFILDDVVTALRITSEGVRVTTAMGRPRRTLGYADIERVSLGTSRAGPGGSRTVATLELTPKRGSKVRIVPYKYADFYGSDGWAALLKATFESQRVPMDAEAANALTEAGSGPAPSGSSGYSREPFH